MKKIILMTIWVVIFLLMTAGVLLQTKHLFSQEINTTWEDSARRIYKVCQTLEIRKWPIIVVNDSMYLYTYFLEGVPVIRGNLDSTVLDKLVKKYRARYLFVTLKKNEEAGTIYVGERKLSPASIIEAGEFKTISFDLEGG